jgi:pilus assembly protein CpaE
MPAESTVWLVTKEPATQAVVSSALDADARFKLRGTSSSLAGAYAAAAASGAAAVLVDIDPAPVAILREMETIVPRFPETRFIVLSNIMHNDLLFEAMQAGARHFMLKRAVALELKSVLARLVTNGTPRTSARGSIITVISASGGCGATTVAVNLANELGQIQSSPALLVDMDLSYGAISPYLGIKGDYGVGDILSRQDHIDEGLVRSSALAYSDTIHVLISPVAKGIGAWGKPLPLERLGAAVEAFRAGYECTVIDAPRLPVDALAILAAASRAVVAVFQLNVKDIHTIRMLQEAMLGAGVPADRFIFLASRYQKRSSITLQEAQKSLGGVRMVAASNDYRNVIQAINFGQPLSMAAPSSALRQEIRQLAQNVLAQDGAGVPAGRS